MRVPVNCMKEIAALPDEPCDIDMEIKVSTKSNQFCQIYGYHKINVQMVILVTPGQHSCNIRTRFLSYPDRIPITPGQSS